jgi:hypothetical protein
MHSDFITFRRLENLHVAMPSKEQTHFLGVWPGDHYILLQRVTLGSMTCLAKVSPQRPLLHHVIYRYRHTLHRTTEQALQENRVYSSVLLYSLVPRNITMIYSSVPELRNIVLTDEHSTVHSSVNRQIYVVVYSSVN